MWPNPEGRPSAFFEITDPFEALHYDFSVFEEIHKFWAEVRERAATGPKTAGEKYQAAVRRIEPSVEARIQKRLEGQRAKRIKNSKS